MGRGIGRSQRRIGIGIATSYAGGGNPFYQALYDSWTTKPNDIVKAGQLETMNRMRSRTYWDKFDAAWFPGLVHINTDGEATKNIISPGSQDLTEVNSPFFNMFSGYKGDAVSKYLNTNWNPSTHGSKYKLNDAHFSVYGLDEIENIDYKGQGTYSANQYSGYHRTGKKSIRRRVNSDIGISIYDLSFIKGLTTVSLKNNIAQSYIDKIFYEEITEAQYLPTNNLYLNAYNNNGNSLWDSDERIGFSSVGAALTESECQQLEDDLDYWFNFEWLSLGNELVINGGFATDTEWAKGTGWSIGSGTASCDGSQVADSSLTQTGILTAGKVYSVTVAYSTITSGGVKVGSLTNEIGTKGTKRFVFEAGGGDFNITGNSNFVGSVDNVSVKEIIGLNLD